MRISIHDNIRHVIPDCRLGCIMIDGITVRGTPSALTQEFLHLQEEVAKAYNLTDLASIPRIAAVRTMYKKLDFDPSRYRPASEALVRRVLQNKGVYYVNSAVDVNNYCSIKFLLPFGIYDASQIEGDIEYQIAQQGDYLNIAGNIVSAEGKPILADAVGVFGNPSSDSRRTAVSLSTTRVLSVVYADEGVADKVLGEILDFTAQMLMQYNGGRVEFMQIIQ